MEILSLHCNIYWRQNKHGEIQTIYIKYLLLHNTDYIQSCMELKHRTNNQRMAVFIDILVDIFQSEIKFANTKSWPLLPYQTLMQRNLFKTECMEFIKHYDITWDATKISPDKVKHEYVRDKNRSQKIFESFTKCLLKIKNKLLNLNAMNFPIYKTNGLMNPMKVHGLKYEDSMKIRMRLKMPSMGMKNEIIMKPTSGQTIISNKECGISDKNKGNGENDKYPPFIKYEYDNPSFHKFNHETTTKTNFKTKMDSFNYLSPMPSPMKIDPIFPSSGKYPSFESNMNMNALDTNLCINQMNDTIVGGNCNFNLPYYSTFFETRNNERVIISNQNNQAVNKQNMDNDAHLTKMCEALLDQFINNNNTLNTNYIDNTFNPPSTVNINTVNNINIGNHYNLNGYNPSNSPQSVSPQQVGVNCQTDMRDKKDMKDNYDSKMNKIQIGNNQLNHLSDINLLNRNHLRTSNEPFRSNQQINWIPNDGNQQIQCNMANVQSTTIGTVGQISNNNSSLINNLTTTTPTTPTKETLTVRYQILSLGPGTQPIIVNSSIVE